MSAYRGAAAIATPLPESLTTRNYPDGGAAVIPPSSPTYSAGTNTFSVNGDLDIDRHGKISSSDLISAYDQDGDGSLSGNELKRLAEQL